MLLPAHDFWAKLSQDHSRWHPLHAHAADVAAVLERLLAPGSAMDARLAATQRASTLDPRHRAALVYLAALHDVGKTNHGFQEKGRHRPQAITRNPVARGHVRVLLESLGHAQLRATLHELVRPLGVGDVAASDLLTTAIAHHGRPWAPRRENAWARVWDPAEGIPRDPIEEVRQLGALARSWSGLADLPDAGPLHVTPALTHLFAGALTLADWVASTERAFPYEPAADRARYWDLARERAERACRDIGLSARPLGARLPPGESVLPRIFPAVFQAGRRPTTLQSHLATMSLPAPGSRLLIESETGSGKTEAALVLFARLRAERRVDGLVFALPTRATAQAMHERVLRALPGIYAHALPSVALAVGGTQPEATSNRPILEQEPIRSDGDDGEVDAGLARWASEGSKRFLAAEVVVGTLDQLLLGALPVRHAHLRLAGLTRHLLVVDELHSYDRFMNGVLRRLLDLHTAHGGMAVFLSATLSESARRALGPGNEAEPSRAGAVARPYPSLSLAPGGDGGWEEIELVTAGAPKRVQWTAATAGEALPEAIRAARAGARVLVVRNTVRGARAFVDAVRASGGGDVLWSPGAGATPPYHSRYAPADRAVLDRAVLASFGRGGTGAGRILCATQVAEQSLDVDFDLLVSDLCPVDVLLQRIGRLWRHRDRTVRPGCPAARALVLVPDAGVEPFRKSGIGPDGWGTVYPDLADLQLTLDALRHDRWIEIPTDNRRLVEAVYHPEARERLREDAGWSEYLDRREGVEFATGAFAAQLALPFPDVTYAGCADAFHRAREARIRTRLGDDRVRIPLPADPPVLCRYATGERLTFVDLPEGVVRASGVPYEHAEVAEWTPRPEGASGRLGAYELFYRDDGWHWERAP